VSGFQIRHLKRSGSQRYSSISVSTVLALHIEVALDENVSQTRRLMSEESIRAGLAYLRVAQENWTSLRWTLRLFDWVFSKTGLCFGDISKKRACPGPEIAISDTSTTVYVDGIYAPENFPTDSLLPAWDWEFALDQGFLENGTGT
jgi:hypothetical protein